MFNPDHTYTFANQTVLIDGDVVQLLFYYKGFIILGVDEDRVSFLPIEEGELDALFENEETQYLENQIEHSTMAMLDELLKGHEDDYKVDGIVYSHASKLKEETDQ